MHGWKIFSGLFSCGRQPLNPVSSSSTNQPEFLLAEGALFYNAKVLVKTITALHLNLHSYFENSPSVTVKRAVWQTFTRSSSISISYFSLGWFSRKFSTTKFSECKADSSASLSASSNIGSFISSLIWGSSNILDFNFPILIRGNFWRKADPLPPCPSPSQSSS